MLNPTLAHRALSLDPQVGLLLPCNVTVFDEGGGVITILIVDPISMLGVVKNPAVEPVATEARARLERVVETLKNN